MGHGSAFWGAVAAAPPRRGRSIILYFIDLSSFSRLSDRLRLLCGDHQGTPEVDRGAQQLQMAGVASDPEVADPAGAVVTLHHRGAALDAGADADERLVEPGLPRLQRLIPAGLYISRSSMPASASFPRSARLA